MGAKPPQIAYSTPYMSTPTLALTLGPSRFTSAPSRRRSCLASRSSSRRLTCAQPHREQQSDLSQLPALATRRSPPRSSTATRAPPFPTESRISAHTTMAPTIKEIHNARAPPLWNALCCPLVATLGNLWRSITIYLVPCFFVLAYRGAHGVWGRICCCVRWPVPEQSSRPEAPASSSTRPILRGRGG